MILMLPLLETKEEQRIKKREKPYSKNIFMVRLIEKRKRSEEIESSI
jgi:hypothetical protein